MIEDKEPIPIQIARPFVQAIIDQQSLINSAFTGEEKYVSIRMWSDEKVQSFAQSLMENNNFLEIFTNMVEEWMYKHN